MRCECIDIDVDNVDDNNNIDADGEEDLFDVEEKGDGKDGRYCMLTCCHEEEKGHILMTCDDKDNGGGDYADEGGDDYKG